jgi:hypothetical protein
MCFSEALGRRVRGEGIYDQQDVNRDDATDAASHLIDTACRVEQTVVREFRKPWARMTGKTNGHVITRLSSMDSFEKAPFEDNKHSRRSSTTMGRRCRESIPIQGCDRHSEAMIGAVGEIGCAFSD